MSPHPLYAALTKVEEANKPEDYHLGIESLEKLLLNIKGNPTDERFRRFPIDDPFFNSRIGFLEGSEKLMKAAGFHIEPDEMGKKSYFMNATAESWKNLLSITSILFGVLHRDSEDSKKSKKKKRDKSKDRATPGRSSSGKSSKSAKSSGTSDNNDSYRLSRSNNLENSRRSGRSSTDSFTMSLESSEPSLWNDEPDFDDQGAPKKKKKKSKKDKKSKKSKKKDKSSSSSGFSSTDDDGDGQLSVLEEMSQEVEAGKSPSVTKKNKWAEAIKSAARDLAEAEEKASSDSASELRPSAQESNQTISGKSAKSKWAMATSSVIMANKADESGDGTGSPRISKTATKDYWKQAATQALVMSRMRDEDGEQSQEQAPKSSAKANWGKLALAAKSKSLETASESEAESETGGSRAKKNWGMLAAKAKAASSDDEEMEQAPISRAKKNWGALAAKAVAQSGGGSDDDSPDKDDDASKSKVANKNWNMALSGMGVNPKKDKERSKKAESSWGLALKGLGVAPKKDNEEEDADEARAKWLGAVAAMKEKKLIRSGSARSLGSNGSAGKSIRNIKIERKLKRLESKAVMRELEKTMSKQQLQDHKRFLREQNEVKAEKRRMLEERLKREEGARCTFMFGVVSAITAAELGLDFVTTIISFVSLIDSFECCGQIIAVGAPTLGVTIPYFVLIVIELAILGCSVRHARKNTRRDLERLAKFDDKNEDDLEWFDDEESWDSQDQSSQGINFGSIVSWILIANPFLGCLITWVLLYEVQSRNEAFVILGLEGASVLLMFTTIYLEREKMSCCSLLIHGIPLIPFAGTCFVVWYYLQKGGICFRDGTFWFDNCGLCGPETPAPEDGICPNGEVTYQDTYCGEIENQQFCYFSY